MKVGFATNSKPNKTLCDAHGELSYKDIHWTGTGATTFKSFFDSRTFKSVDLGSHAGEVWNSKSSGDLATKVAIFHMHSLCLKNMIANYKQACEQHGYLNSEHSDTEQRKMVVQFLIDKG